MKQKTLEIEIRPLNYVTADDRVKPCPKCKKRDYYPFEGEELCTKCTLEIKNDT